MGTQAQRHCANLELATGWALHALEPADEATFARHLPTCAECAAEVQATEDLAVLFAADVEQIEPPAHLREAVLNAARSPQVPRQSQPVGMTPRETQSAEGTEVAEVSQLSERRSRRRGGAGSSRRLVLAAAAAVILAFGAVAGWVGSTAFTQPSSSSTNALTEQNVMSALTDPAVHKVALTDSGSSTTMALLLAGPKDATVVPVNMPSTADNSQYVLWGVPNAPAAKPVALGGVSGSSGARGAKSVNAVAAVDPASFSTYAVSVEPAGPMPASPSTIVATGQAKA